MIVTVPVAWLLVGASLMLSAGMLLSIWITDRAEKAMDRKLDLMRCGVSGIAVGGRPAPVCCLDPGHAGKHKAYEPTVGVIDWEVSDGR